MLQSVISQLPSVLTATNAFLLAGALFLGLVYTWTPRRPKSFPPGPPVVPVLGSLPFLSQGDPHITFGHLAKKYGNICSVALGMNMVVIVNGYESIKATLVKKSVEFAGRPEKRRVALYDPNYLGIIVGTYDKVWKKNQKLCLQFLTKLGFGKTQLQDNIKEEVEILLKSFESTNGTPFDPKDVMNCSMANILLYLLFGRRRDYNEPQFQRLTSSCSRLFENFLKDPFGEMIPALLYLPSQKKIEENIVDCVESMFEVYNEELESHIKTRVPGEPRDFLDMYLEEIAEGSDPDINKERMLQTIHNIFGAGTETMATTMRWAIIHMANHRDIQAKVHTEIDDNIGRTRQVDWNDSELLPYTCAVMLEVQRISMVTPLAVHSTTSDTSVLGFAIPKDTQILLNLSSCLSDEAVWPEAHLFRPERFLDSHGKVVKKEEFIPYSLGRRMCLGEQLARMEYFLYFTSMMQKFQIQPPDGASYIPLDHTFGLTIEPTAHSVKITLRR